MSLPLFFHFFGAAQLRKADSIKALREASRVRVSEGQIAGVVGGRRSDEGEGLRQVARRFQRISNGRSAQAL